MIATDVFRSTLRAESVRTCSWIAWKSLDNCDRPTATLPRIPTTRHDIGKYHMQSHTGKCMQTDRQTEHAQLCRHSLRWTIFFYCQLIFQHATHRTKSQHLCVK